MHLLQMKEEIQSFDSTHTGLHLGPVSSTDFFVVVIALILILTQFFPEHLSVLSPHRL